MTLISVAAFAGACSSEEEPRASSPLRRDVTALGRHFEEAHADLGALVPGTEWTERVDELAGRAGSLDRDETVVELMRLAALPGRLTGGDGHSGVFPLDDHDRELHLFPLRLYEFPDGLYVVDAPGRRDLVGARLVGIGDTPVDEVAGLVEPLVPRDNEMTLLARLPQYLVVAEVLQGLGVVDPGAEAEFHLQTDGGEIVEALSPVPASAYADATGIWHPMIPPSLPPGGKAPHLRRAGREWWSAYLPDEDVVFVQYNQTLGDSFALGRRIVRLVRRHDPRGVVLDLRHNPGGENAASAGLLEGLTAPSLHGDPLAVLVGRSTFSAAGYLSGELAARTGAVFVGEATGFSTRFFGDPASATLPVTGVVVNAGGVEWKVGERPSYGAPLRPQVQVDLTADDYFAGRDPVLARAIELLRRD